MYNLILFLQLYFSTNNNDVNSFVCFLVWCPFCILGVFSERTAQKVSWVAAFQSYLQWISSSCLSNNRQTAVIKTCNRYYDRMMVEAVGILNIKRASSVKKWNRAKRGIPYFLRWLYRCIMLMKQNVKQRRSGLTDSVNNTRDSNF